jgi:hypothetical protein
MIVGTAATASLMIAKVMAKLGSFVINQSRRAKPDITPQT